MNCIIISYMISAFISLPARLRRIGQPARAGLNGSFKCQVHNISVFSDQFLFVVCAVMGGFRTRRAKSSLIERVRNIFKSKQSPGDRDKRAASVWYFTAEYWIIYYSILGCMLLRRIE